MKGWQVILLCMAFAALAVVGTLLFIRYAEESIPQVDTPRYTADQVIAVAKAYAGECNGSGEVEAYDASWTTVYLGDGKWIVTRECEPEIPWESAVISEWTFYEATGELKPRPS